MAQAAEPRIEAFGLMDDIQEHVPEEDRSQSTTRTQEPRKRTVAVNRRGPKNQRAAVDLDTAESDEDQDDLDASADGADATSSQDDDPVDDLALSDETDQDDDTGADESAGDDADDGDQKAIKAAKSVKADSRSRKQLHGALEKQAEQIEKLQMQADAQASRATQSNTAQQDRNNAEADEELDGLLDEVVGANVSDDEALTAGDLKKQQAHRKKLQGSIDKRVDGAVKDFALEEADALFAVPGAKDVYNKASASGLLTKLRAQHHHVAPLIFAIVNDQHNAEIKNLEVKHKKVVGNLNEKLRRRNLDDIPTGQGSRGEEGTGQGPNNGRPRNPMDLAMANLSKKQGIPVSRARR